MCCYIWQEGHFKKKSIVFIKSLNQCVAPFLSLEAGDQQPEGRKGAEAESRVPCMSPQIAIRFWEVAEMLRGEGKLEDTGHRSGVAMGCVYLRM